MTETESSVSRDHGSNKFSFRPTRGHVYNQAYFSFTFLLGCVHRYFTLWPSMEEVFLRAHAFLCAVFWTQLFANIIAVLVLRMNWWLVKPLHVSDDSRWWDLLDEYQDMFQYFLISLPYHSYASCWLWHEAMRLHNKIPEKNTWVELHYPAQLAVSKKNMCFLLVFRKLIQFEYCNIFETVSSRLKHLLEYVRTNWFVVGIFRNPSPRDSIVCNDDNSQQLKTQAAKELIACFSLWYYVCHRTQCNS